LSENLTARVLGFQLLVEFFDCDREVLNDVAKIETILCEAVVAAGARVVKTAMHKFSPQGVSGVVLISESHVTIHTWPQKGYAAVDIFTCGDRRVAEKIRVLLEERLRADGSQVQAIDRGAQ
jgi:S-adenosylmethionine decarboxylase proenzyme